MAVGSVGVELDIGYVSSVLLQRVFMDTASCFLYQIVLSSQRIGAYLLTTHVHS